MSIFQLNGDTKDDVTQNQGQPNSQAFANDVAQITQGNDSTKPNPDAVTPTGDNPTVILDGPYSRIMTQALNLVLANEDTSTMYSIMEAEARSRNDWQEDNTQQATFVYAGDADNLTVSQCADITNFAVQNQGKGDIIISLESHGNFSKNIGLVRNLSKQMGFKLVYSRDKALEAIKSSVTHKKA